MRYRLLALLCIAAVIAYLQRAAISVPLKTIASDLNVSSLALDMGWVQSAWYAGYAAMQLPSAWVANRLGSRAALSLFCVLWSLLTMATGFAPGYWSLLVIWTLMGAAQAGIFPCATKAVGQTFTEDQRAGASGWLACGMQVGGALAALLTPHVLVALAPYSEPRGIESWRACLCLYGLPGLLWAGLLLTWISANDLPRTPFKPKQVRVEWGRIFFSVPLSLLCLQQFLRAAGMVFFLTWFPSFLQNTRDVSLAQSGLLTFLTGASGTLGSLLGGLCSDEILRQTGNRRLSRQGIAMLGMASCAVLIVASYFVKDTRWAIALISAGVFGATFGGVSGYTVAIDFGGKQVATVFSTMNMCGNIGAMLFPITAGWLVAASGDWNFVLFFFAGIMAAAAICWGLLNPQGTLFGDEDEPR